MGGVARWLRVPGRAPGWAGSLKINRCRRTCTRARPVAPRGVVATTQPLAASAGLAVLRRGGDAVDAAIATAAALTVLQPGSNDIGSDLFALVWDGSQLHGLNASGRSPALLTRDLVLQRAPSARAASALGGAQAVADQVMPARGWLPVTVPGAPAAGVTCTDASARCRSRTCSTTRSPTPSTATGCHRPSLTTGTARSRWSTRG